jgi:hypothetical protein
MPIESHRVPRTSAIGLALVAHLFLVFLLLPAHEKGAVRLVPQELKSTQITSQRAHLTYNAKAVDMQTHPKPERHQSRRTLTSPSGIRCAICSSKWTPRAGQQRS